MFSLELKDMAATEVFGRKLGEAIHNFYTKNTALPFEALLLRGPLGSGKTSLTRALVTRLPGGNEAEISSPSFTLCNHYATIPSIVHCDLYRTSHSLPDEVWDALEDPLSLCIVEWAEYMPEAAFPKDFLDISFEMRDTARLVTVKAKGKNAKPLLQNIHLTY